MRKRALICVGVILSGCATNANSDIAEMTRIEKKCGLKSGTFQLDKEIGFKFNIDPNEKYENAQCALSELRSSKLWRHINVGFVGNELPPTKPQD